MLTTLLKIGTSYWQLFPKSGKRYTVVTVFWATTTGDVHGKSPRRKSWRARNAAVITLIFLNSLEEPVDPAMSHLDKWVTHIKILSNENKLNQRVAEEEAAPKHAGMLQRADSSMFWGDVWSNIYYWTLRLHAKQGLTLNTLYFSSSDLCQRYT